MSKTEEHEYVKTFNGFCGDLVASPMHWRRLTDVLENLLHCKYQVFDYLVQSCHYRSH